VGFGWGGGGGGGGGGEKGYPTPSLAPKNLATRCGVHWDIGKDHRLVIVKAIRSLAPNDPQGRDPLVTVCWGDKGGKTRRRTMKALFATQILLQGGCREMRWERRERSPASARADGCGLRKKRGEPHREQ